ncbi:MAG: amidohydrolase family protein [Pseudomonadales bacterium]|nr:amidohydrolase family protein [Pseudomonadales bacterium]
MRDGARTLLIANATRLSHGGPCAVRIRDGVIAAVADALVPLRGERVIDAKQGLLLPGLHDHHLHLYALAAARESLDCGPPRIRSAGRLAHVLRAHASAQAGECSWLRGVGYHETVAGPLDRMQLDALVPDRPLRIQHTSGKAWFVNSAGLRALGIDRSTRHEGIERDAVGEPTGRLFRMDDWLRARLAGNDPPDLAGVSAELAAFGITGLTDTSPANDPATVGLLAEAQARGSLHQQIRVMGGPGLRTGSAGARLTVGEYKILLDEDRLPDLDELIGSLRAAHAAGRGAALHCVTRTELVFALHALQAAGPRHDRIEHASVTPLELLPLCVRTGVSVVTQPGFVATRGDRYLDEADADERPHLYRLATFLAAGVPLGLSSDAPYGETDPWTAMRAAMTRRTRHGRVLGEEEALTPEAALAGYLGPLDRPGGPPRTIVPGAPADLCLLEAPWARLKGAPDASHVRLTLCAGDVVHDRDA